MFTGLVEGMGTVASIVRVGPAVNLMIAPPVTLSGGSDSVRIGESIAINGCCLTLVQVVQPKDVPKNGSPHHHASPLWVFQAGAETLSRTNLGQLEVGSPVNLERALRVSDRLGGHFVQGHVDGTGTVDAVEREGEWVTMWFSVSPQLAGQMVEKGSVCIDGVSLTVVDVELDRFSIALIPHTLEVTTLGSREVGDTVNIETDIIGKYVERLAGAILG